MIGSFPTAFLLVKWKAEIDIRQAGSGNVGTLNTMEVTGSKGLGIAVLIIDMLKGVLSVVLAMSLFGHAFWIPGAAGLSAIAGHSFPVWLKFKGGRGLATAAGVFLVLGWVFVVIWLVLWGVTYLLFRSIHAGNVLASLLGPFLLAGLPSPVLSQTLPGFTSVTNLFHCGIAFSFITLVAHRDVITELIKRPRSS